ncbi:hypothetical protein ANN_06877 [Periplaneta americana]|uniref:DDE-1 domain-containing protein n=1 Tax=Periplaneta americana TaxID=6978 RepID=A0ABQ8TEP2_PERAM|nr:hypothetical protein ANN_06877 [Periplaneta americana]
MSEQLKKGAPPGTVFAAHHSGWIQMYSFIQWFRHFEFANPTKETPELMLLDSHFSHTQNIDLIDLAKTNHVTIVSMPPHSSQNYNLWTKLSWVPSNFIITRKSGSG